MSQFTLAVRRSPRRAWLVVAAVLVVLAALMLVWIGRASAGKAGPTRAAKISKTVSNIVTGKADAVDATSFTSTNSFQFSDMPDMLVSFKLGGTARRAVIVLFESEWFGFSENTAAVVRLTIDGVVQSGPANVQVAKRFPGEPFFVETHGFNFISDPISPGLHVARIQWRTGDSAGNIVASSRSLIVLHK